MSSRQVKNVVLFALLVFSLVIHVHCEQSSTDKIKITTTTALLGSIVHAIGADRIEVSTIVPAGMCPGHFDLKADNVQQLSNSKVLLSHGWETWTGKLLDAVDSKPLLRKVGSSGNLMIPDNHLVAAANITSLLCSLDNSNRDFYIENHRRYISMIDSLVREIMIRSAEIKGTKVICSALQEEFIQWLGLDIVLVYPRAEELTPMILAEAISRAKNENIELVIDNLQSGADVGVVIAEETKTEHIVLTNFPLGDLYPETLMQNFLTVVQALQ
ncbi:MAG: metal ABC transporter substrate-binding protein [bacterium]